MRCLISLGLVLVIVAKVSSECMYNPGTPGIRDIQVMSKAGGNWPVKIGSYTHTPLRVKLVRGSEVFVAYNIWTPPSKTTTAACKKDANCGPMNKWFWIDGQSNDPLAGKKGAKIDPKKRRFIALNVKVNRTKGSNGKYTWRLDCNNCCKSK